jgi:hypothetical protein
MAWEESNPINFAVDGDTTSEAIEKFIAEFGSVYTHLNRLRKLDKGSVAPTDPETDAVWLDDTGDGVILKTWTGTVWSEINMGQNPIGGIIPYNGAVADIPANWQLCDGTNGTPNMTNKFMFGTNTEAEIGNTGGSNDAVVISHTHTLNAHTHSTPDHTHTASSDTSATHTHTIPTTHTLQTNYTAFASGYTGLYQGTSGANGAHSHVITVDSSGAGTTGSGGDTATGSSGVAGTNLNIPAYVKLAYIQRMS